MTITDSSVRLLAAVVLGGIVGLERQLHGRPAGLRTHILVSIGAAVAVIAGVQAQESLPGLSIDTGRIIAGIITGIGFLGAGTIVRHREGVGGLTTAACIWFVAMVGVLCGFAFYTMAGIASVVALLVLLVLDSLEEKLPVASYWMLTVESCNRPLEAFQKECQKILKRRGLHVKSSTFRISDSGIELSLVLRAKKRETDFEAVEIIRKLKGVTSVKWAHRSGEW
ncbi:MAG: MgtC/SapB family protein [Candidatus Sabulitectum sp.]|nr:MgtC/SapB family protein [Candidatus Sabulitectum sp.]